MRIEILATESLGVRGLCCVVEVAGRSILIDPGMAMGYIRHGLMPHPVQVAAGERIREGIVAAARAATDVVISHFPGDHVPVVDADANPCRSTGITAGALPTQGPTSAGRAEIPLRFRAPDRLVEKSS